MMIHILFAVALIVPLCSAVPQPLRTITVQQGGTSHSIQSFADRSVIYASADELAAAGSFRLFSDASMKRIELLVGTRRLKLSAENPFVPVIDHASNVIQRVEQLPLPVRVKDSRFFVPLDAFLALVNRYTEPPLVLSTPQQAGGTREARTPTPDEPRVSDRGSERLAPHVIAEESAAHFDIPRATVDVRKNGTVLRIHAKKVLEKPVTEDGDGGVFVLTIPHATVDENEFRQTPLVGNDVRSISAVQLGDQARIEISLGPGIEARSILKDAGSDDLLLTLYRTAEVGRILSDEEQDKKPRKERTKSKWALDCIVIDAGHGGRDPGAIGVSGIKEKNITLGIALKLGALIEQNLKGVRVVFTRDDDRFIELDRRGKIANEAEGKLFISIHCNSTEKKPSTASGTEIYLLRPGRTEEAIRVAEFENSVIRLEKDYEKRYQKLTNENFIIITMAQSAYVKYSERFADLFHEEVRAGKKLKSLGVKQAGFYVLVGASMPSVLVEAGFLSNPKDEAFLSSQAGQSHLAMVMLRAIEQFATEYEKSLKE